MLFIPACLKQRLIENDTVSSTPRQLRQRGKRKHRNTAVWIQRHLNVAAAAAAVAAAVEIRRFQDNATAANDFC